MSRPDHETISESRCFVKHSQKSTAVRANLEGFLRVMRIEFCLFERVQFPAPA